MGTLEGIALVQQVGHSGVGLMLDTFHMRVEGEDLAASLERAMPFLRHIHLLDLQRSLPRQAAASGFDEPGLVHTLARLGFQHYLSMPLVRDADDTVKADAVRDLRALINIQSQ